MIEMRHVGKKFEKEILRDVSLSFPAQGAYCLMGPSGSGKTTFLRLLMGLERPDQGEISHHAKKISVVFQENRLLTQLTCLENVRIVGSTEERAYELLKLFGLENGAKMYPNQLSGGMARRCALARAAAFDGDIYLLDEPFSGIDVGLKDKMIQWVKDLAKHKLVILSTHDLWESVQISDHILLFQSHFPGKIRLLTMKETETEEEKIRFLREMFMK